MLLKVVALAATHVIAYALGFLTVVAMASLMGGGEKGPGHPMNEENG